MGIIFVFRPRTICHHETRRKAYTIAATVRLPPSYGFGSRVVGTAPMLLNRFRLKTNSSRQTSATTSETAFPTGTVSDARAAASLFTELVDSCLRVEFDTDGGASYHCLQFEDEVFGNIEPLSLGMYALFPEYFVPFLFTARFDQFSSICQTFNIPIPPPPGKTQKRDRALYISY